MCAALLFAVCPVSVAISAYKCIDEDDAIYFSDKQCDTRQAQPVIGIKPAPPAVAQERVAIEARQARQQRIHEAEAEDREARREQRAEMLAQKKAMKQQHELRSTRYTQASRFAPVSKGIGNGEVQQGTRNLSADAG